MKVLNPGVLHFPAVTSGEGGGWRQLGLGEPSGSPHLFPRAGGRPGCQRGQAPLPSPPDL